MAYQDRILACNNGSRENYLPFFGRGQQLGWIRKDRLERLSGFPDIFVVGGQQVDLHAALFDYDSATAAVDYALRVMADEGLIQGWRDERYAVAERFSDPAVFSIERAGCPFLGIRSWGFHLNGYVRKPDGLYLWIAQRAHDKPSYPGLLDNTVAGGHPEGLTLAQNLIKECAEEASIPAHLARQARAVGAISYLYESPQGLKPDQMFCYDLELDESFTPIPADGEVAGFYLMPAQEVMEIVRDTDRFKFHCAPVLIDFFIRHGLIDPDREPDYVGLCEMLHGAPPV